MKKYNITTNQKSFEVESNSMISAMFAVYRKFADVEPEEIIAVIREDYADEIMTIAKTQPSHQDYRDLIDIVWNYVYEDTSVPSTSTADKLIEQWIQSNYPQTEKGESESLKKCIQCGIIYDPLTYTECPACCDKEMLN